MAAQRDPSDGAVIYAWPEFGRGFLMAIDTRAQLVELIAPVVVDNWPLGVVQSVGRKRANAVIDTLLDAGYVLVPEHALVEE